MPIFRLADGINARKKIFIYIYLMKYETQYLWTMEVPFQPLPHLTF